MNNVHENHRARMKAKYDKFGESTFDTHQLMEMLLFSFVCRKDTNTAAHEIIKALPDGDLFSAQYEDLRKAEGIGKNTARGMKLSADTVRRLMCDHIESDGLNSEFSRRLYVYLKMLGKPYESISVTVLSAKNEVLDFSDVTGEIMPLAGFVEKTVKRVKMLGGDRIILCHSHGRKTVDVSAEDLYMTSLLKKKLSGTGVSLLCHYIVNDKDCSPCMEGTEL